jgi:hypothetical protein
VFVTASVADGRTYERLAVPHEQCLGITISDDWVIFAVDLLAKFRFEQTMLEVDIRHVR